jgi:hypothetical protein
MRHSPILDQLRGGDRRSLERVPQVIELVSKNLELVGELEVGLVNDDPIIRMRAADALEKVSMGHPALLDPFKDILLNVAADSEQQEVRWHIAQMLPRLKLSQMEMVKSMLELSRATDAFNWAFPDGPFPAVHRDGSASPL